MNSKLQTLALKLFERGAVKFGQFKLKIHETNPEAPLSPIYFNLRNLDTELLQLIGEAMLEKAEKENIRFTRATGLPEAGIPLADAFRDAWRKKTGNTVIPLLGLSKITLDDGTRKIVLDSNKCNASEGDSVLLIDDVLTGGDSKIEPVGSLRFFGISIAGVMVLVDRQQSGGAERLEKARMPFFSIFTVCELIDLYVEHGLISKQRRQEVLDYLADM